MLSVLSALSVLSVPCRGGKTGDCRDRRPQLAPTSSETDRGGAFPMPSFLPVQPCGSARQCPGSGVQPEQSRRYAETLLLIEGLVSLHRQVWTCIERTSPCQVWMDLLDLDPSRGRTQRAGGRTKAEDQRRGRNSELRASVSANHRRPCFWLANTLVDRHPHPGEQSDTACLSLSHTPPVRCARPLFGLFPSRC